MNSIGMKPAAVPSTMTREDARAALLALDLYYPSTIDAFLASKETALAACPERHERATAILRAFAAGEDARAMSSTARRIAADHGFVSADPGGVHESGGVGVSAEDLAEVLRLAEQQRTHAGEKLGIEAFDGLFKMMLPTMPRLAREVVILRALAAHKLPCGHGLEDIVYGGPDVDGLPAIAKCGQCLADRQAAKAALPRTPETVLRAMLRVYEEAAIDAGQRMYQAMGSSAAAMTDKKFRDATEAVNDILEAIAESKEDDCDIVFMYGDIERDYAARLAGTRPLDAPPLEDP